MSLLTSFRSVVSTVIFRDRLDREMNEELATHIEHRAGDLRRTGLSPAEAERRARIEFGGPQRFKDECREQAGAPRIETLAQDAAFAFRMLRRSPGFTAVAILTLALGIGANTAIFSVVYAALLRPLPYAQPNRLITVGQVRSQEAVDKPQPFWETSYPDFQDWVRQSKSFQELAGYTGDGFLMRGLGDAEPIVAAQVSTNFFHLLGVKPMLGRDFTAGEDIAAGPTVTIVTYNFWRSRLGGDPQAVGRSIRLNANNVTIVGVLPEEFEFAPAGRAKFFVPLHLGPAFATRRNLRWFSVIGRLAPAVSESQAHTEMNLITERLNASYPQQNSAIKITFVPLRDRIVGQIRPLLLVLFGAVVFVLLIACANVANLLMTRATRRRREFAVRAALGAGRGRLISQLLSESLMLALAGAAAGLAFAMWGTKALIAAIPQPLLDAMPYLRDARANPAVLAFLAVCAVVTGIVFGLAPVFEIGRDQSAAALKEESRGSAGARSRLRDGLVVAEIAFSLVLLTGAGLMAKSLGALLDRNPGFDTRNLLSFSVNLRGQAYQRPESVVRFDHDFVNRLQALPGITGAAMTSNIPLSGNGGTSRFVIDGKQVAAGQEDESKNRDASSGFFAVMKVPLVEGRYFNDLDDGPTAPQHVIVTRAWARKFLHGESAVGKRIRFTYSPTEKFREIVGVVGDIADGGLDSVDEPVMFLPFLQDTGNFLSYVVRTTQDPAASINAVRAAIREMDEQLVMIAPLTMEQMIGRSNPVFLRRYPSYLIGSFAGLALILAMIGLYGLISYSVSQRTREVGIRMALGAQRGDVVGMVLRQGARLAIAGVAIGVAAAFALTRLLATFLFGVSAADPATFTATTIVVTAVAMAACCIPAARAMRTDPVIALRYE